MLCPSQDYAGDFDDVDIHGNHTTTTHQGQFGVHYSYRYNTSRSIVYGNYSAPSDWTCDYGRNVLERARPNQVIFTDAADYRGVSIGGMGVFTPISETVGPAGYTFTRKKWAHLQGGHVATHDGAVSWRRNDPPPFAGNTWPAGFCLQFYWALDRKGL